MDDFRLFASMLRIRRVEEALAARYAEQEMRCPMHLCIGQEAIAAGVCGALAETDLVYGNHRAHGHYLAKGGSLPRMVAELYGRRDGCCGGRGGSMHLIDQAAGFIGATPIVGGTVPLAVGSAWASQQRRSGEVVAVFFGDGCFEEGVVHESLNFAQLKQLPVLFVCENNGYSVMTGLRERQPERSIAGIAAAHGLAAAKADGNDVRLVHDTARSAIARARAGGGPQFLELSTYRWPEHCGPNDDDDLGYRPAGELRQWQERCPIARMRIRLLDSGELTRETEATLEGRVAAEIADAFAFALDSPPPAASSLARHVYAENC